MGLPSPIIDALDAQRAYSQPNAAKTLKNKCAAVQTQIANRNYTGAINKLTDDFLLR